MALNVRDAEMHFHRSQVAFYTAILNKLVPIMTQETKALTASKKKTEDAAKGQGGGPEKEL